jgi:WXXGXW repeat (2 copies)
MRRSSSIIWFSLMLAVLALPAAAQAQVICTGNATPPPELPVYDQPPIPGPGYIWTPGYWGGGPSGYFWVPGTWVQPPSVGLLWTPGYWGWRDGIYVWNAGYWGPHIGFYGGVNYGFGYSGVGFEGGRWVNGVFAYNRIVNNFGGVTITNVYEKTVVVAPGASRVSFNGGSGGITLRATPEEEAAAHEQHVAAIPAQLDQERTAGNNRALLASENRGQPPIAATSKPGDFSGKGFVAARSAEPGMPATTKPAGAAAINPGSTAPGTFEKKEMTGKSEQPLKGETPLKPANTETKPLNTEAKLPNSGGKPEPLNTEGKPLNTEGRLPNTAKPAPLNTEAKPPNTEAKLPNNSGKPEPFNTGMKPPNPEMKSPNTEAKLPNNGGKPEPLNTGMKPQTATPPKAANPPPQVTGSNAHPKPAPNSKDKNPPPG